MAQVLLATVTAPKGPPCRVRQMANIRMVLAAMYPAKKIAKPHRQTINTFLREKLSTT